MKRELPAVPTDFVVRTSVGRINAKLRSVEGQHFAFWCPGCDHAHGVPLSWSFDGNYENPTIQPSLRINYGKYDPRTNKPIEGAEYWCHFNITRGALIFYGDCTHQVRGEVAMPNWPDVVDF